MLQALREDDILEGMTTKESTLAKLNDTGGYVNFHKSRAINEGAMTDCS